MNVPIRAICRRGLAEGVALAGIRTTAVDGAEAGAALLAERIAARAPELLIVEDAIVDALAAPVRARLDRQALPLVVVMPGPARLRAGKRPEEEVLAILRRAVGYHVRMR
jgi:vacuolar-type H+-ATPase subunit F/Vma7